MAVIRTVNHLMPRFIRQFPFTVLLHDLNRRIRTGRPWCRASWAGANARRSRRCGHLRVQRTVRLPAYPRAVRTDNDTWDIKTSVGSTALFVATARALEAQKPDALAIDPYAEMFCRAVGGEWADALDGEAPQHDLVTEFGEHFVNFQGARTKYFDAYFRKAADAGVRQIVLLAAGLDARAYRLAWPDGTVVFELDQPRVLEFKRDVLAAHGATPSAERREIAIDLRNDWPQALRHNGFDVSTPSAWIAEGLLIYLPATAQHQVFTGIDALAAPGSHLAVEEAVPMEAEDFAAKREEERAAGNGDTFFTLVYNEQHAPAARWFGKRGWRAARTRLTDYLRQVGRPVPAADSEAGSMIGSIGLVSATKA
jgi:methyltransferase (TIGR00027 family)